MPRFLVRRPSLVLLNFCESCFIFPPRRSCQPTPPDCASFQVRKTQMAATLPPQLSIPQLTEWNDLQDATGVAYNLSTVEPGAPLQSFPFRTSFFGIGLCRQGQTELQVNLETYTIKPDSLIIMGPAVIRRWTKQAADYATTALFFTEQFFIEDNVNTTLLRQFSFFGPHAVNVLPLTSAEAATVWQLLQEVKQVLAGESRRKAQLIRSYVYILLNLTADYYERHLPAAAWLPTQPQELVNRFKQLVRDDYHHQRLVADYAAVLCVTAKHLGEAVKAATNKTAGEWIAEMVLLEAKVQLKQTGLSVSQVADFLHFSDASAFGKFFRRQTGLTPLAYRRQSQG